MMWLPASSVAEWLESVDAGDRAWRPITCRSTCSSSIPNAPLKEEMARAELVAGARR